MFFKLSENLCQAVAVVNVVVEFHDDVFDELKFIVLCQLVDDGRLCAFDVDLDKINRLGSDYNTVDGTCMRDYVHVLDIAHAHINALDYLQSNGCSDFFNLGSDHGHTVKQIISKTEKICGQRIHINMYPRRAGDVATLLADSSKAHNILQWKPQHSNIENILQSALKWEQQKINAKKTQEIHIPNSP